ncbi:hypothetical protein OKA04_00610 [Luteolibacter flavescens]|uniref:Uncharacterized protein n=1 Tax=Luteolibacter flavescens TaxID=1859460 RepID=A0ABT3FI07_9BACT|nr:hypothetical protein [Luteolibacter flavescens]MCW1883209.1 hypothetical protein [Luteolibacter flavescens]
MLRTPPQLFEDFEAGLMTREQLHVAMSFHARTLIEEVVEASENPLAAWWEGLLAKKTAARLVSRHGERRVRAIFAALADVPDFLPAHWLWNANHPDVPVHCFLRLRKEPIFRIVSILNQGGILTVRVEYGANDKHETTREEFVLGQKLRGGFEVTSRRAVK